jgi:hypothetical protein
MSRDYDNSGHCIEWKGKGRLECVRDTGVYVSMATQICFENSAGGEELMLYSSVYRAVSTGVEHFNNYTLTTNPVVIYVLFY